MSSRRGLPPRCAGTLAIGACLLVAGCGGGQSALDPQSPPARNISTLWWWMLGVASVIFLGAVGLLGLSWLLRHREGVPVFGNRTGFNLSMVVLFGIAIPFVILVALFVIGNFVVMPSTDAPAASRGPMTIQVIGRQYYWEVRYPTAGAVTANEIHIPVGTKVTVEALSGDVIHSFWVPQLNRKVDAIPGRRNRVTLLAEKPGRYRGQCAEFCGLQHAHMGLYVYADPPQRFRSWLAAQARRSPAGATAQRGERVFMDNQCASCHAIRGTAAAGRVGPDLTHVGSRDTLASLTIPNTPAQMEAWIRDPQRIKPGNRMPALGLSAPDVKAVVTYLEGLK